MAFLQVSLFSRCLMRTVSVNVILPTDKQPPEGQPPREETPFKTLYLLHGVLGSQVDWVNGTRIQRFAEEHDLAVVMPAGDNAFYVDHPETHNYYGQFVGQELVEQTRKMFPLSRKREDTFIGGLSMGGYGAMRNGLKYSGTFGCILPPSGALHTGMLAEIATEDGPFFQRRSFLEAVFGDLSKLAGSDMDPKQLARGLIRAGKPLPRIYMACGDQDFLLPANRDMAAFLKAQGAHITFEVGPGSHDWDFWDTYIQKAISWLPTGKSTAGLGSGNVGVQARGN